MVGNPWYYRGHNLEWNRIRLLTKWDDIIIDYNASGIRTRKGDTYYELDGDTIISETTNGNTIRYYYGNGGIVGFRYNGVRYYYEKNLQGDIIAIYNDNGDKLCEYVYDAWGNCTIKNDISDARIGEVNSFRYRGYYYDSDLGLYYLKSRYYDAQTCRFINADSINYLGANGDLGAYNLFAYCGNKPVNCEDPFGHFVLSLSLGLSAAATAALAAAATALITITSVAIYEISSTVIEEAYVWAQDKKRKKKQKNTGEETDPIPPNVSYPGNDPTIPPGDDYEWRGKQPQGGDKGSWVNKITGEQWHPDLNHPYPKGPHWDYTDIFGIVWTVYETGKIIIWE